MHRAVPGDRELVCACRGRDADRYVGQVMITVPPVLQFLTNSPLPDEYDLSSLRVIIVGAAPVSPDMIVACRERYAKRGVKINIGQGLGMTEMCTPLALCALSGMLICGLQVVLSPSYRWNTCQRRRRLWAGCFRIPKDGLSMMTASMYPLGRRANSGSEALARWSATTSALP